MFVNGVVKLNPLLFGILRNASESENEVVCNTMKYYAPEVFEGKEECDSDVWSLGITLIELAEGKNPFENGDLGKLKRRICDGDTPSLSTTRWSSDFVDFVAKCLKKKPKQRASLYQLMTVNASVENDL